MNISILRGLGFSGNFSNYLSNSSQSRMNSQARIKISPTTLQGVKQLDLYPKPNPDIVVRFVSSAVVSILTYGFIGYLLFNSIHDYFTPREEAQISLWNNKDQSGLLAIFLDISFPSMDCDRIHIDFIDSLSNIESNNLDNIKKQSILPEGCRVQCHKIVNRAKGELRISFDHSSESSSVIDDPESNEWEFSVDSHHFHRVLPELVPNFNSSHFIHSLYFGSKHPWQVYPLDGVSKSVSLSSAHFHYNLQIVPSIKIVGKNLIFFDQFSTTENSVLIDLNGHDSNGLFWKPGVFFQYDFSPYMLKYVTHQKPLHKLLTQICMQVGGVFAMAGICARIVSSIRPKNIKLALS